MYSVYKASDTRSAGSDVQGFQSQEVSPAYVFHFALPVYAQSVQQSQAYPLSAYVPLSSHRSAPDGDTVYNFWEMKEYITYGVYSHFFE